MADYRNNDTGISLRIPQYASIRALLSLLSSMLNKRLVYDTRGFAYVRIQAVGVTNCRIKKGVTNCRNKKMVEHTDNQKQRGNTENKTAFYYIRYRQANVSRTSALISGLEIVAASKSPVSRFFQFFYDRQRQQRRRQTDKTDCLTPLAHTRRGVIIV